MANAGVGVSLGFNFFYKFGGYLPLHIYSFSMLQYSCLVFLNRFFVYFKKRKKERINMKNLYSSAISQMIVQVSKLKHPTLTS